MRKNKTNLTKLQKDILYIRRLYYISRLHLGPLSAAEIAAELRMRKMWPL